MRAALCADHGSKMEVKDIAYAGVSIVIPAYNAERHLVACLNSVFEQTYDSWHVVLVNDGSTDTTELIGRDFASSHPGKVTMVSTRNQGACRARNYGLSLARGQYVAFLDSDDVWLPTKLCEQVSLLQENPDAIGVTCNFARFSDNDPSVFNVGKFSWNQRAIDSWLMQIGQAPALGSTLLVRRSALDAVGGFDPGLGSHAEDLDLAYRLHACGPVLACDKILVGIRAWSGQNHAQTRSMDIALLKVIKKHSGTRTLLRRSITHIRIRRSLRSLVLKDWRQAFHGLLPVIITHPIWSLSYISRLAKQQHDHRLRKHPTAFFEVEADQSLHDI